MINSGLNSMVECYPSKLEVESSSLSVRSKPFRISKLMEIKLLLNPKLKEKIEDVPGFLDKLIKCA